MKLKDCSCADAVEAVGGGGMVSCLQCSACVWALVMAAVRYVVVESVLGVAELGRGE